MERLKPSGCGRSRSPRPSRVSDVGTAGCAAGGSIHRSAHGRRSDALSSARNRRCRSPMRRSFQRSKRPRC
jgi:hypothetical protein